MTPEWLAAWKRMKNSPKVIPANNARSTPRRAFFAVSLSAPLTSSKSDEPERDARELPDAEVVAADQPDRHRQCRRHEPGDRSHDADEVERHRPIEGDQAQAADAPPANPWIAASPSKPPRQTGAPPRQRDQPDELDADRDARRTRPPSRRDRR